MGLSHIIVLIMMLATLAVLVAGIGVMMIGGKLNAKYSGKLMMARVGLQGLTLLLVGLLFFLGK
jgi:hypothetical protein